MNARIMRLLHLEVLMPHFRAQTHAKIAEAFDERDSAEIGRIVMEALDKVLTRTPNPKSGQRRKLWRLR
jgi:hypothetical protein